MPPAQRSRARVRQARARAERGLRHADTDAAQDCNLSCASASEAISVGIGDSMYQNHVHTESTPSGTMASTLLTVRVGVSKTELRADVKVQIAASAAVPPVRERRGKDK